jgi:hypothetical protein
MPLRRASEGKGSPDPAFLAPAPDYLAPWGNGEADWGLAKRARRGRPSLGGEGIDVGGSEGVAPKRRKQGAKRESCRGLQARVKAPRETLDFPSFQGLAKC